MRKEMILIKFKTENEREKMSEIRKHGNSKMLTTLAVSMLAYLHTCIFAHCVANAATLDLAGEGWRLDGTGELRASAKASY